MPKYDVHIYAIVRLKIADVDADSPTDAVRKAEDSVDLHQAIAQGEAEYAEAIEGFLVDALDMAGKRIDGQTHFFNQKEDDQSMKHPTMLLKLTQMGRLCLRFLWAVGRKLKPRGRV